MTFAGRGIVWRVAAPTLVLSVLLLATVAIASLALRRMQLEADRVIDQAMSASEAAERVEQVFDECRRHLTDYASAGQARDVEVARGLGQEGDHDLVQVDGLVMSERSHSLVAEMERYTVVLQRELNQVPTAPTSRDTREAVARRVIGTLLDPQLLSRAREERELCVESLHAARKNGLEVTRRADWALFVLGMGGTLGGVVAGFGIARSLRRELIELSIPIRSALGSLDQVVGPVQVVSTDNFAQLDAAAAGLAQRVAQVVERLQSAERDRLRNDQMAALGQLAAGLAHELRNPLTAMKTIVDAARRDPETESLNARDLAVLDEEIQRLNRSLQSFLDYARPPAIATRRVDLASVVERTCQLLAGRAEQQSIRVVVEPPERPIEVDADPEQLHQVLLNLLLNAFDAVRSEGQVTIRIERRRPSCAAVTVADNGPGISQAVRDRLFEPFVSTKESGTGLGLTICRRIVEDHRGCIEAANGPQGGAIFTVTLPTLGRSAPGDKPVSDGTTTDKSTNGQTTISAESSMGAPRGQE
jgi:two-component system, NtrC family, sensor histidine kinase HydH